MVRLGMLVTALLFPAHLAWAAQASMDEIVAAAAQILYHNEGSYNSVNPNDNGAVSIGKLQWHGWRALSLLQEITVANEAQAQELLGNTLYKEVVSTSDTSKWGTRKLTSKEAAAVKKLLATDESKAAQDVLAVKDITSYIQQGQRLGITNEPALVYFADLTNQGGSGASGRVASSASKFIGSYGAVTLNELHEAALCDSVMGYSNYQGRRFATYQYAAGLGWAYCAPADSYIPSDYPSARDVGTAWVQRALNTCMDVGLAVTDTYDSATKAAVGKFQSANRLTVDGYAGKDTIVAMIRKIFKKESVAQTPGNSAENPGTATQDPASDPGATTQDPANPGAATQDPASNPGTSTLNPTDNSGTSAQNPAETPGTSAQEPPAKTLEKAVLKASKGSYAVNDTYGAFTLDVTSNHAQEPLTYRSSEKAVVTVDESGKVKVVGAGKAEVIVRQRETDTYTSAELTIPVTVYSTNPSDYPAPVSALYEGKNMKKQHVQWLQATLISLDGADITVNGSWPKTMTKLVTAFQKKCGIAADGIVGDQTQDMLKRMLAVKGKKPEVAIKCSAKANTLTWKKYTKANRVYIYRKEKGGAYKRLKAITNMKTTSYQDKSAKAGATYYYVIRYAVQQNKVTILGPSSKGVAGVRK